MSFRSFFSAFLSAGVLLGAPALAHGQNRINAEISSSSPRVTVPNTQTFKARAATDLGAAPAGRTLSSVTLRFNMTDAQSAALTSLLAAQQNPSSPQYHQWLTPEQFGVRFGLSSEDLAKVTAWLKSEGLTVTGVARGKTFVTVSGSVAQVNQAFGASIHSVSLNGEQHIANVKELALPAPVAGVVHTITGLSDFHPRPHIRPRYTNSSGSHFVTPADFYTIYDMNSLLGSSINGSGITIAVAGQTDISTTAVAGFRSAAGLSATLPTVKLYGPDPGVPSSSDLEEAQLDVEWSGATAPAASILYVNSEDVIDTSLTQIIDNNLAPIATVSYGDCEANFGSSAIAALNRVFQQASAQGQTILGPAGDSGATDCDYQTATAVGGLAVDFPGSSPYVTSVGGSMFNEGSGTYWNTTNGTGGGSALSYIPETVWNETAVAGELSAGGGGASQYFTKPYWQIGTGVPTDSSRDVPDLVFNAAANHDGYIFCGLRDCTSGYANASGTLDIVGGTSVATPSFAGVLALLEQKLGGTRLGTVNPTIYALANSSYSTSVFHDITSGNNSSPCTAGTPNCASGGSIGYNAGAGFDEASGWGSLDVYHFVTDYSLVTPLTASLTGTNVSATTVVSANSTQVSAGQTVALSATVASSTSGVTTTPTGTVQFLVDGAAVGNQVTLSGATASYSLSTTGFSSGAHTVTAAYSGDNVYAGSKGVLTLDVVSSSTADFSLTPSTATVSVKSGATASGLTYTVAPTNGFTGNVTFSASTTSSTLNAEYTFSVNPVVISSTATGATVFTLTAAATEATGVQTALRAANRKAALQPLVRRWSRPDWKLAGSGAALAGLMFLVFPRRRRGGWSALMLAVIAAAGLGLSGCSTSSATSSANTTPGTYTILITATGVNAAGATLTHTSTVTFVVN